MIPRMTFCGYASPSLRVKKRARLAGLLGAALVVSACSSCGGGSSSGGGENGTGTTPENQETGRVETPASGNIPLPDLPSVAQGEEAERQAPTITNVEQGLEALRQGFYDEVEAALSNLPTGAETSWLRAELLFAMGRYDDALALYTELSEAEGPRQALSNVRRAEVHMARGRYDDANEILEPLLSEQNAHRAHFLLGELRHRQGLANARSAFMELIRAYNDERITTRDSEGLGYVGSAAFRLNAIRDANDAFIESKQASSENLEMLLDWTRLFLRKYDAGHAEENMRDVFAVNPNHPLGLALMARVLIEQSYDFAGAETFSQRALEINPNQTEALVNLAGIALRDLDFEQADALLDRALAVNPNDLEALSTRAAVRFLQDDDAAFEAAQREVLSRNRGYSELYRIIGDFAEWEHRYPDIVQMSRDALEVNARDEMALAALGLNLLRMGEEEEGLQVLRDAWRRDRFNVRVFNTLNLYDEVIPEQYTSVPSGPFQFRFHNDERAMLERYAPRTLTQAHEAMVARYGFTPEGPLHIEMYNNPQHFAIRTTGLPALGVQGVCFGKVVTAISPEGGPFNWGQITWHELAHVFHIQLSENHVPRWFTEGLAEYETILARPDWRREMDHHLHAALQNDSLPQLRLMNRAFTHADSAQQVVVAYYASTQIVRYIAEEHGIDKLPEMLRAWAQGLSTEAVVQRVLGVDIGDLDRDFRASERQRLAHLDGLFAPDMTLYIDRDARETALTAEPQSASAQAAVAASRLIHGDADGAREAAEAAVANASATPNDKALAHFLLARLARDEAGTRSHLQAILDAGMDGYDLRLMLARLHLGSDSMADAESELRAATRLDADRQEAWMGLAALAERTNNSALAREATLRLAAIDEHNRAIMLSRLEILVEESEWPDAVDAGVAAVFSDPHNPQVHALLSRAHIENGQAAEALYEADSALIAEHPAPGEIQLLRARALMDLGRRSDAQAAAQLAAQADASLSERADDILNP